MACTFQGDYRRARSVLTQALDGFAQTVGEDHSKYIDCLSATGVLRSHLADSNSAEEILKRAIAEARKLDPSEKRTYIGCIQDLSSCYVRAGRCAEAEPLGLEVMHFYEQNDPSGSPSIILSRERLGRIYAKLGKFDRAGPLLDRALADHLRLFGGDTILSSFAMQDFGEFYVRKGDYESAEPLLTKALAIQRRCMGPDNPEIKPLLDTYSELQKGMGHKDDATSIDKERERLANALTQMRSDL